MLASKLADAQAHGQAQAVELAQLRERLAAAEQINRTDADKHAVELVRAHEVVERQRIDLETLRKTSTAELDQLRVELASVKATTESDLRHAREEVRNHQLATEQSNGLVAHVREELTYARNQVAEAREEAARLRGQVEAIENQRTELVKVLAERSVAAEKGTQ